METHNATVTCVIKTNPDQHFSAIAMIPTMNTLDAYETLTPTYGEISHREWLALRGNDRKRARIWQLIARLPGPLSPGPVT
jgi:hypothetical protein